MKKIAITILFFMYTTASFADTWVNGYTRKNGTQVQGHYRSDSNSTKSDNWSTRGNSNPYTGQKGYKRDDTFNSNYNSRGNYGY